MAIIYFNEQWLDTELQPELYLTRLHYTSLSWQSSRLFLLQTSQIDEAVKQLDNESRDVLMKYIYRSDLFKLLTCYFRLLQLQLINRLLVPIYPDRFTMFDVLQSEYQRLL